MDLQQWNMFAVFLHRIAQSEIRSAYVKIIPLFIDLQNSHLFFLISYRSIFAISAVCISSESTFRLVTAICPYSESRLDAHTQKFKD